jgi:hypothetical protein
MHCQQGGRQPAGVELPRAVEPHVCEVRGHLFGMKLPSDDSTLRSFTSCVMKRLPLDGEHEVWRRHLGDPTLERDG